MSAEPTALSLEERVLLCCARAELSPRDVHRLRTLAAAPELDGERLLEAAVRHRLLPLVFHHLDAHARDLLPAALASRLRTDFMENTRLALWTLRETLALTAALESRGIPVLQFKGTSLSIALYGRPNLRIIGDMDIIVPETEVPRALEVGREMGYREHFDLTPGQRQRLLRDGHHVAMRRDDGMYVEIHWRVSKRVFSYPVDMDAVWSRSRIVRWERHSWRTLAPGDLLPILAIQASKESWRSLERLASVAEAARRLSDAEWETALASAEAWGAGRTLRVGLLLAERLLGTTFPGRGRAWIAADPRASRIADSLQRRMSGRSRPRELMAYQIAVREGIWPKLRFLAASAFTAGPEDWEATPLPDRARWLYPLLRPFRLLRKSGA